jgi:hypothetical protein
MIIKRVGKKYLTLFLNSRSTRNLNPDPSPGRRRERNR